MTRRALIAGLAAPASAAPYVVCDSGIRCVRAPCPSTNALDLAGPPGARPSLTVFGVGREPTARERRTCGGR